MGKFGRFLVEFLAYAVRGNARYYGWLLLLGAVIAGWCYSSYMQFTQGLIDIWYMLGRYRAQMSTLSCRGSQQP